MNQPKFPDLSYRYRFPVAVFEQRPVQSDISVLRRRLQRRNVYYRSCSVHGRELLLARIAAFDQIRDFVLKEVNRIAPGSVIVSLYLYGSYLYGGAGYQPDDIDLGVVVRGGMFKYVLRDITIPPRLSNNMHTPVSNINMFFYGYKNMVEGVAIDDTVRAEMIHKETTKRGISVGYWRNVVLYGRDFCEIAGNKYNVLVTMFRLLEHTYQRLCLDYLSSVEIQRKIAMRLFEANVFLSLFNTKPILTITELHRMIKESHHACLVREEIESVFANTFDKYMIVLDTYL